MYNRIYQTFYQTQLDDRRQFNYPPFFRLIEFTLIGKDMFILNEGAEELAKAMRVHFFERVLGPEFPLVARIRNEFYKKIMLKVERDFSTVKIREHLHLILHQFRTHDLHKKIRIKRLLDLHCNVFDDNCYTS